MSLAVAGLLWWVAGQLGWHSRLPVVLAAAVLVSAIALLLRYTGPAWSLAMPTTDPPSRPARAREARTSDLRRMVEDATSHASRANPARSSPTGLQQSLRDIAVHRLRKSAGVRSDAGNHTLLAFELDPVLSRYLCSDPPPPITTVELTDIIRRIEKL